MAGAGVDDGALDYFPDFDRRWGVCVEELFHHTSRYYKYAEAVLRNLSGKRDFTLDGYRPQDLSPAQRRLMAALLSESPDPDAARAVTSLVAATRRGDGAVDEVLLVRYREALERIPEHRVPVYDVTYHAHRAPPSLPPLDPFLAVAERLGIPVAVRGHHVEVSLRQLAEHLDSPLPQVRENLQAAVQWLHEAGYRLRNHPDLTHAEAAEIGGDPAPPRED